MKTKVIAAILISFIACSCNFVDDNYSVIPPQVQPHVDEFVKIARSKGISIDVSNLKVEFVKFGDLRVGCANSYSETIKIDTSSFVWKTTPEALIFHEMGHLFLGRGHDNEMIDNTHVKSIMHYNQLPYYTRSCDLCPVGFDWRQYYINELFISRN